MDIFAGEARSVGWIGQVGINGASDFTLIFVALRRIKALVDPELSVQIL